MIRRVLLGIAIAFVTATGALAQTMPIGSIVAYAGATAPTGWLLCNGAPIPAGTQYDPLRKLLGVTTTPDLQGYFLRGLDPSGKVDPDSTPAKPRAILSMEADGVGPHSHTYTQWFHNTAGKSGSDFTGYASRREFIGRNRRTKPVSGRNPSQEQGCELHHKSHPIVMKKVRGRLTWRPLSLGPCHRTSCTGRDRFCGRPAWAA